MKQFLSLIIISIVFATFAFQENEVGQLTQLVVTIPELDSSELQGNLEIAFASLNGVKQCETSLMTRTLMLNYDSRKISQAEIDNIFNKWECSPRKHSYQQLY
tara:strand:- start:218 stop:526 length:309 start_codon:yes stop_codon:yes gene_type:complete